MRSIRSLVAVILSLAPVAFAGMGPLPAARAQDIPDHSHHHHPSPTPAGGGHSHEVGPAGETYDLRWIDAMVQHHSGALRMAELVFAAANRVWGPWPRRSGGTKPRRSRPWANGGGPGTPRARPIR